MKYAMIFFLCILVVLSGMADAPFVLPDNVSVVATNTTGKGVRCMLQGMPLYRYR